MNTVLPVTATIGGVAAPVTYHGSVPPAVAPGPAVPIVVSVGGAQSQRGVTIAVK